MFAARKVELIEAWKLRHFCFTVSHSHIISMWNIFFCIDLYSKRQKIIRGDKGIFCSVQIKSGSREWNHNPPFNGTVPLCYTEFIYSLWITSPLGKIINRTRLDIWLIFNVRCFEQSQRHILWHSSTFSCRVINLKDLAWTFSAT